MVIQWHGRFPKCGQLRGNTAHSVKRGIIWFNAGLPSFMECIFHILKKSQMEKPEISCFIALKLFVYTNTFSPYLNHNVWNKQYEIIKESTLLLKPVFTSPAIFAMNCMYFSLLNPPLEVDLRIRNLFYESVHSTSKPLNLNNLDCLDYVCGGWLMFYVCNI